MYTYVNVKKELNNKETVMIYICTPQVKVTAIGPKSGSDKFEEEKVDPDPQH